MIRHLLAAAAVVCVSAGMVHAQPRKSTVKKPPPVVQKVTPAPAHAFIKPPTHVEFEGSELRGQAAKSGAIYVVERRESPLRSLVRARTGFRTETTDTVR